jgi:hypothetical protein
MSRTLRPAALRTDAARHEGVDNATRQPPYDRRYLALALIMDGRLVTAEARFHRALRASSAGQTVVWVEDLP